MKIHYINYKQKQKGGQVQLITILLILTAILTFVSGFSVWSGAKKSDKKSSKYFTLSVFFAAIWAVSIAAFLALRPEDTEIAKYAIFGVYIPALFMDVCLMVYCGYPYKFIRTFGVIMAMLATGMSGLLLYDSSILYSSFALTHEGNSVALNLGWFYYLYIAFYFVNTVVLLTALFFRTKKTRNKGSKAGLIVIGVGTAVAGSLMLIFNVILPLKNYDYIWVGPMALSIVMISHYYAVLNYRLIQLNSGWLRALSYVIILTTAATIYMLLFYIVFTAIFKTPNPSPAIFTLNFLMVVIVLLLLPAINEISSFVRSLISQDKLDLKYIIKKLDLMSDTKTNLNELSGFLADHLHFSYVGIIANDKLYGSEAKPLSTEDIKSITKLTEPTRGIWQYFDEKVDKIASENDLTSVAILYDKKGKRLGQIIFGKPQGKFESEQKELIQLEMIINLSALVIEGNK